MEKSFLLVGFGGFLGSGTRFLVTRYIQNTIVSSFPWSTLGINVVGSFLIGVFFAIYEKGLPISSELRLFFVVGFCGGFTTFSAFTNDAFLLLQNKDWFRFAIYPTMSFFLSLVALFLGRLIIKSIWL